MCVGVNINKISPAIARTIKILPTVYVYVYVSSPVSTYM
jgi:hypothetical protein